jgi:hypothetical protein
VPIDPEGGANLYSYQPRSFVNVKICTETLHPTLVNPEDRDGIYLQNIGTSTRCDNPRTELISTSNHNNIKLLFFHLDMLGSLACSRSELVLKLWLS